MTVTPRAPASITLPVGRLLYLTSGPGARAALWRIPENMYGKRTIAAVLEEGVKTLGPFNETRTFKLIVSAGEFEYEAKELIVAKLEVATDRIRSATVIAKAINEGRHAMSVLDRIKAKAVEAKSVVPDAIRDIETDLDAIIAEKKVIAVKRAEATAPHLESIAGMKGELESLKSSLDLLSNGGPDLDPLPGSDVQ